MQTIKTAIVVVLLLFVLYGGYVAMNGTDTPLKPELEGLIGADQLLPDVSGPGPGASSTTGAGNGFDMFNSTPSKGFASNTAGANTSPFGGSSGMESTAAPLAFPNSNSGGLQPAPLLTPPSANPVSGSLLPPLASTPPSPFGSPPPASLDNKFPPSLSESTYPISTNTPELGNGFPESKLSNDISTNSAVSPIKPLQPIALPTDQSAVSSLPLAASALPPAASPPTTNSSASKSYENAKDLAMEQIDRRNLRDALATLSVFYNAPEITTEQRQDLNDLLDALSREVVFSRSHLMDMAYVVAPGETIEQVAKRYDIPTEILARINAIDTTSPLRSGEKLKVVPGPFRAEVDLAKNELTIFLGDLYAGRYPVTFGAEPPPKPGVFQVMEKQKDKNYYGNGVQIPATDPRNPFGGYWIDLGHELCIHGSSNVGSTDSKLGCISLSPMDANDVFGMLAKGSQVTIRR